MESIKAFLEDNAGGLRTVMLRNQGDTVYDIYMVFYSWSNTSLGDANEVAMAAVSQRTEDQVEDLTAVGFDLLGREPRIHFPFAISGDLVTSGSAFIVGNLVVSLPKPLTVATLAGLFNIATSSISRLGIEVLFERRRNLRQKAQLVAEAGNTSRT